ncbi:MAG: cell division protein ZapA [Alphaproteobacteria bacterium]|nr:cell division protein ZapA [Alphaproteobacteria bacterium]
MPTVTVTVNGRSYPVTCDAGQEPLVEASAAELDRRVQMFVKAYGQPGEGQLLVLAGLMLAAELTELRQPRADLATEAKGTAAIEAIAHRIEAIAGKLERTSG